MRIVDGPRFYDYWRATGEGTESEGGATLPLP